MKKLTSTRVVVTDPSRMAAGMAWRHTAKYAMTADGRFIHQSDQGLTDTRVSAWAGTFGQFDKLCEKCGHDPDEFKLVSLKMFDRNLMLKSPDE